MVSIPRTEFDKKELKYLDSLRTPSDKSKGLVEACSESAVLFAEHMLGMKLYYWQIKFLQSLQKVTEGRGGPIDYVLALTSRQIGKSTTLAVYALWASFFNKKPDKRFNSTQVLIVSRSDTQAKKLLRDVKRTYVDADRFMRYKYLDEEGNPIFWYPKNKRGKQGFFTSRLSDDDSNNATMINWRVYDEERDGEFILKGSNATSGVRCYPPTDVVLGETFTIGMVDEAAHPKIESDFWYQSLKKTGDANKAMWVFTSTPWKPSGFFYDYCDVENRGNANFVERLCFTVETLKYDVEAGHEGATIQYESVVQDIEREKAMGQINAVKLGYFCEFVSGETTYFDPDQVYRLFRDDVQMLSECSEPCDLGIDFAGSANGHSTMTVARYDEKQESIIRLYHKRFAKGETVDFIAETEKLMKRFNIQRIVPDECLDEDTLVLMGDRSRKRIADIKPGQFVMSWNPETEKYEQKRVLKVVHKGEKPTKEVVFRNGTSVFATSNHEWFVKDGKHPNSPAKVVDTNSLNEGYKFVPQFMNQDREEYSFIPEAYLLGMYIAEGHKRPTKKAFFISQLKEDMREKLFETLSQTSWTWQVNKKGAYLSDVQGWKEWFDAVGKRSYNKVIPNKFFQIFGYDYLSSLYEGLIDGDGYVRKAGTDKRGYKSSESIVYCTSSKQLARDVQFLGRLIGKPSTLYSRVHSGFGSKRTQYEVVYRTNGALSRGRTYIKEVKEGPMKKVVDIKVEDNKSFVLADSGVVTHNCPAGFTWINAMTKEKGWNVTPMSFRTWKVKKYGSFRAKMAKNLVVSYEDEILRDEMLAMEYSNSTRQSYIQPSMGKTDDLIDGLILASFHFLDGEDRVQFFDWKDEDDF